jgi:hypothetical protein
MSEIYLDNNIFVSIQEKRKGFQSDVIVEMLTSSGIQGEFLD